MTSQAQRDKVLRMSRNCCTTLEIADQLNIPLNEVCAIIRDSKTTPTTKPEYTDRPLFE